MNQQQQGLLHQLWTSNAEFVPLLQLPARRKFGGHLYTIRSESGGDKLQQHSFGMSNNLPVERKMSPNLEDQSQSTEFHQSLQPLTSNGRKGSELRTLRMLHNQMNAPFVNPLGSSRLSRFNLPLLICLAGGSWQLFTTLDNYFRYTIIRKVYYIKGVWLGLSCVEIIMTFIQRPRCQKRIHSKSSKQFQQAVVMT